MCSNAVCLEFLRNETPKIFDPSLGALFTRKQRTIIIIISSSLPPTTLGHVLVSLVDAQYIDHTITGGRISPPRPLVFYPSPDFDLLVPFRGSSWPWSPVVLKA